MFDRIPKYVTDVVDKLHQSGYEAFLVGGCVRDILLNKTPCDYDITTSATPNEILSLFQENKVITTGLKHGTVTVLSNGNCVEVTTYRIDGEYSDSRHPQSVTFTRNLSEDLSRRDFTINAMAYSKQSGLVDLFGGLEDLQKKCVRCVGESEKRFDEDALRILRCLRFASTLDFYISPETSAAAAKQRHKLSNISAERKAVEFIKLICGVGAQRIIREELDILSEIVPELKLQKNFDQKTKYHNKTLLEHTLCVMSKLPCTPSLRLAALFHDCGKPEAQIFDCNGVAHYPNHPEISAKIANRVMSELKLDKKTQAEVLKIINWHDKTIGTDKAEIKTALMELGENDFFTLMKFKRADNLSQAPEFNRLKEYDLIETTAQDIISKKECYKISMLDICGNDLTEQKIASGAMIGKTLKILLDLVIREQIPNQKQELIKAAKTYNEKITADNI